MTGSRPRVSLGDMVQGQGQTLAPGILGSLARMCTVPEVLGSRGRQGSQVLSGQGRVFGKLGMEHRGLVQAYARD